MEIILYTSPTKIKSEQFVIREILKSGLSQLHIRKPDYSYHEMDDILGSINEVYHPLITIHSHYSLLDKYNLKGIHIGRKERRSKKFQYIDLKLLRLKHKIFQLSTTYHSAHHLEHRSKRYDYLVLSPVFKSISTKITEPAFDLFTLSRLLEQCDAPIAAYGGINSDTVLKAKKMGFFGAILQGAIWKNRDPLETFHKINKIVTEDDSLQSSDEETMVV